MRHALMIMLLAALSFSAAMAVAGTQNSAQVALHAQPHPTEGGDPCTWDGSSCWDFNLDGIPILTAYDLYLIVVLGDPEWGIAALSCGIAYGPQVNVIDWTFCGSGQEFPNVGPNGVWPASEGGNRMTWDPVADCQRTVLGSYGVHALFGSFYVYAYGSDFFGIIPNNNLPSGPELLVGDCNNAVTDIPQRPSWVGFGSIGGCNPCLPGECPPPDPIAVAHTTWGGIKTQY